MIMIQRSRPWHRLDLSQNRSERWIQKKQREKITYNITRLAWVHHDYPLILLRMIHMIIIVYLIELLLFQLLCNFYFIWLLLFTRNWFNILWGHRDKTIEKTSWRWPFWLRYNQEWLIMSCKMIEGDERYQWISLFRINSNDNNLHTVYLVPFQLLVFSSCTTSIHGSNNIYNRKVTRSRWWPIHKRSIVNWIW